MLNPETLQKALLTWAQNSLAPIGKAIVVFILGWFLIKLALKLLTHALMHTHIPLTLHAFILSLSRISLIVLLSISCAVMSRLVEATSVVTALGAIGLAVSLAVKDGLANIAGGFSVLASSPFAVGDYISTDDDIEGTVEKIDLIHTMLKTIDNKMIYVPNGTMSTAIITNYTAQALRRLDLEWSIGYHADLDRAKQIVHDIIAAHTHALSEPEPLVRMLRHDASAIVLISRVWVKSEHYWDLRYDMLEQVKHRFDELEIAIPYPQLDVHVKQ